MVDFKKIGAIAGAVGAVGAVGALGLREYLLLSDTLDAVNRTLTDVCGKKVGLELGAKRDAEEIARLRVAVDESNAIKVKLHNRVQCLQAERVELQKRYDQLSDVYKNDTGMIDALQKSVDDLSLRLNKESLKTVYLQTQLDSRSRWEHVPFNVADVSGQVQDNRAILEKYAHDNEILCKYSNKPSEFYCDMLKNRGAKE